VCPVRGCRARRGVGGYRDVRDRRVCAQIVVWRESAICTQPRCAGGITLGRGCHSCLRQSTAGPDPTEYPRSPQPR
jgi:hypothetical protein